MNLHKILAVFSITMAIIGLMLHKPLECILLCVFAGILNMMVAIDDG